MRKVLFMFGELRDADVEWLAEAGRVVTVPPGHRLLHQGVQSESLFILLDGRVAIEVKGLGEISRIGAGEILGEVSFVDSRPPLATVTCLTPTRVLDVPRRQIHEKLAADDHFAARFYRAVAVFLADRLRGRSQAPTSGARALDEDVEAEGEMEFDVLDKVTLASARFERLLHLLERGR